MAEEETCECLRKGFSLGQLNRIAEALRSYGRALQESASDLELRPDTTEEVKQALKRKINDLEYLEKTFKKCWEETIVISAKVK